LFAGKIEKGGSVTLGNAGNGRRSIRHARVSSLWQEAR
jgi:hypothetical protein